MSKKNTAKSENIKKYEEVFEPEVNEVEDIEEPIEVVEAEPVLRGIIDNCEQVFLRTSPEYADNMALVVKKGEEVIIDTALENDRFYKVEYNNSHFYVAKGFVTIL